MVTIKDIAREAGVSYATVSRALNNVSGTKDSTAKRIKEIAKSMGYQRNTLAAGLVTKRTNTIGFILPEIANPFFTKILSAVSSVADEYDLTVLICSTGWDTEKEWKELKTLSERRVDGILLYPSSDLSKVDKRLEAIDTPLVLFGDISEKSVTRHRTVNMDNILAGRLALEHILACAYKRIAFLGGPSKSASSVARLKGVREALADRGLELDEANVSEEKYTIESGYNRCKKMLKRSKSKRPDAFICGNDLIALGALQAVLESPYEVGKDIGVMGFDDVEYAALPQIQLSTVRVPCEKMGVIGTHMLLQEIFSDNERFSKIQVNETMKPELIQRKTTRGGQ